MKKRGAVMNPTLLLTSKLQENGHRAIDMDVVFLIFPRESTMLPYLKE
jgi:hypothetical protein